jgi:2-polyprenyl-3-methyl-5-hydroxy-6-metoxy-1,4-benzoquinol methylase
VDSTTKSKADEAGIYYDTNYRNFDTELYSEIRREAFGEDIGQNSWLTADEQDRFLSWFDLSPGKTLLDVACGAGGPALCIAAKTGTSVIGIDVHEQAIATGNALAEQRGLSQAAEFRVVDAAQPLPFSDSTFDAITCIDAINHFPDRPRVIGELVRLLKPKGRLLFTDPLIVNGPLTNAEIAVRSAAGFYLFVPPGYDEQVLVQCGLRVVVSEDVTQNTAEIADRRRVARELHAQALREIEGNQAFAAQQEFLTVASRLAKEGRLSRFVFVAEKPR